MPPAPRATASTSRGPGREVKTTSLTCATALGVSPHVAPWARCGLASSWRRSVTTMVCPALRTLRAIGPPMLPSPMKPIRMRVSSSPRPSLQFHRDDKVQDDVLRYTNAGPGPLANNPGRRWCTLTHRRFELVLPESVDDCVRALAQRGP